MPGQSPPIRLEPLRKKSAPAPPSVSATLSSLGKSLTPDDLKADPLLASALRSLKATTQKAAAGAPSGRAATASGIVTHSELDHIRGGLSAKLVAKDDELRASLRALQKRATTLKINHDAHKFSAIGEIQRPKPPTSGPPSGLHPAAGLQTVASIGPGWVGPHRVMESYRRPTGPGKR